MSVPVGSSTIAGGKCMACVYYPKCIIGKAGCNKSFADLKHKDVLNMYAFECISKSDLVYIIRLSEREEVVLEVFNKIKNDLSIQELTRITSSTKSNAVQAMAEEMLKTSGYHYYEGYC